MGEKVPFTKGKAVDKIIALFLEKAEVETKALEATERRFQKKLQTVLNKVEDNGDKQTVLAMVEAAGYSVVGLREGMEEQSEEQEPDFPEEAPED